VKKKVTAEDLAASAWSAAFSQITVPVDIVPPGWHTAQQLAEKTRVPVPTIQQKLKRLLATGKAERKMFRVRLVKQTRPVPHYRLN
jgi:predicted transcriptional regulator